MTLHILYNKANLHKHNYGSMHSFNVLLSFRRYIFSRDILETLVNKAKKVRYSTNDNLNVIYFFHIYYQDNLFLLLLISCFNIRDNEKKFKGNSKRLLNTLGYNLDIINHLNGQILEMENLKDGIID